MTKKIRFGMDFKIKNKKRSVNIGFISNIVRKRA